MDGLDSVVLLRFLQLQMQNPPNMRMVMFLLLTRPDKISTYFKQHDVTAIFYVAKIWVFVALDSVSHGITDFLEIVGAENNSDIPE